MPSAGVIGRNLPPTTSATRVLDCKRSADHLEDPMDMEDLACNMKEADGGTEIFRPDALDVAQVKHRVQEFMDEVYTNLDSCSDRLVEEIGHFVNQSLQVRGIYEDVLAKEQAEANRLDQVGLEIVQAPGTEEMPPMDIPNPAISEVDQTGASGGSDYIKHNSQQILDPYKSGLEEAKGAMKSLFGKFRDELNVFITESTKAESISADALEKERAEGARVDKCEFAATEFVSNQALGASHA